MQFQVHLLVFPQPGPRPDPVPDPAASESPERFSPRRPLAGLGSVGLGRALAVLRRPAHY